VNPKTTETGVVANGERKDLGRILKEKKSFRGGATAFEDPHSSLGGKTSQNLTPKTGHRKGKKKIS